MRTRNLLTTLVVFLMATAAFAQNNFQDVVYLKNGSIIRGMIIEQVPNESLKIETADGNLFVFKIDEVEKMAKERVGTPTQKKAPTPSVPQRSGTIQTSLTGNDKRSQDEIAKNLQPVDGKAIVYIVRPSSLGSLIKMGVDCDGQRIGSTKSKQYLYTIVNPGSHTFSSKAENRSTLNVTLNSGGIYYIEQQVKMGIAIARNKLQLLSDAEGKNKLNECTLSPENVYKIDNEAEERIETPAQNTVPSENESVTQSLQSTRQMLQNSSQRDQSDSEQNVVTAQSGPEERRTRFGIKGGLNVAYETNSNTNDQTDSRTGLYAGIFWEIPLGSRVGLQPELVYSMQGDAFNNFDYINIPLIFRFYVYPRHLSIDVGPQVGYMVNTDGYTNVNKLDGSICLGLSYKFPRVVEINFRVNVGMTQIFTDYKYTNSVGQLGVGFRF